MKIFFRIILSLILGVVSGSIVNMILIIAGSHIVIIPENFNPMNAQDWPLALFIFPFLAHSLGSLTGGFLAAKFSKDHSFITALMVGAWFLAGGTYMVVILPAPNWFIILDICVSYIPMALLGWKLNQYKLERI